MREDQQARRFRHQAILIGLLDLLLSPMGAATATMMPHLSGVIGTIAVRETAGRAPIYSPLEPDFQEKLEGLAGSRNKIYQFEDIVGFNTLMENFINQSVPYEIQG